MLLVPLLQQLVDRDGHHLVQVPDQRGLQEVAHFLGVPVGPAEGLGDDVVDDPEALELGGRQAQELRREGRAKALDDAKRALDTIAKARAESLGRKSARTLPQAEQDAARAPSSARTW